MKKLTFISILTLAITLQPVMAQDDVTFAVHPTARQDSIRPLWNGLVWFFPFFAWNLQGEPNTWYKETQPFIHKIILITATGGRPAYPDWEILRKDDNGDYYYDFTLYDSCLDATLSLGYLPTINFMAIPLVLGPENPQISGFGWIMDPPTDYNVWYDFSKKVVEHTVERYGASQVSTWYWRLGGEPDNPDAWGGTQEDYYKWYDYWADAVRSALPTAKLGPGNILGEMEDNWGLEILDHVFAETNYYTGQTGSPISFFTFSAYESCEKEFPPMYFFYQRMQTIKDKLQQYNALGSVEIGTDEGQLLLDENKAYLWGGEGTEYGAAWQAAYQIFGMNTGLHWMFQWNFTSDGVNTPKYNVIKMFEKLEGDVKVGMEMTEDNRGAFVSAYNDMKGVATVNDTARNMKILLYNHYRYRTEQLGFADSTLVNIKIGSFPFRADKVYIRHWIVDKNHSNFFTQWLEDSKDIPRVNRGGWPGSIYDAEVTGVLDQDGKNFWYDHKQEYMNMDDLDSTGNDMIVPVVNDSVSFSIYIHSQEVSLFEIMADTVQTGIKNLSGPPGDPFHISLRPNPFSDHTGIFYTLEEPGTISLKIFSLQGKLIKSLDNKLLSSGTHMITWDGTDEHRNRVSAGIYILRVQTPDQTATKKLILIR